MNKGLKIAAVGIAVVGFLVLYTSIYTLEEGWQAT